jgi:hypothetical protein
MLDLAKPVRPICSEPTPCACEPCVRGQCAYPAGQPIRHCLCVEILVPDRHLDRQWICCRCSAQFGFGPRLPRIYILRPELPGD